MTPITARMIPTVHRSGMLAMKPMIIRTTPNKIILSPLPLRTPTGRVRKPHNVLAEPEVGAIMRGRRHRPGPRPAGDHARRQPARLCGDRHRCQPAVIISTTPVVPETTPVWLPRT
jgi:hypothetical protein